MLYVALPEALTSVIFYFDFTNCKPGLQCFNQVLMTKGDFSPVVKWRIIHPEIFNDQFTESRQKAVLLEGFFNDYYYHIVVQTDLVSFPLQSQNQVIFSK